MSNKKPKMGRPTLPKGESKDIQVGVRFKPDDNKPIEIAAKSAGQTKADWIRNAALEQAKNPPVSCKFTAAQLNNQKVYFEMMINETEAIIGSGTFYAWPLTDGKMRLRIESSIRDENRLKEFLIPQKYADFIKIKKEPKGDFFTLLDAEVAQRQKPHGRGRLAD